MHHLLPKYDWLGIDMKGLLKKKSLKLFFSSIDTYHSITQKVNKDEVLQSLKTFLNTDNYILEKNMIGTLIIKTFINKKKLKYN